jgi:protein-disulfide isomerase
MSLWRMARGAILAVTALVVIGTGPAAGQAAGQAGNRDWNAAVAETEGGHRIGNPAATLKVTEYISYTCPHCAQFAREGEPALKAGYIAKGQVNLEIRHLIRDPVDLTVAMLTNCGPASKFPQNHSAFMLAQDSWMAPMSRATTAQRQRWTTGDMAARRRAIAADFGFYPIMERRGYSRTEADRCLADEATANRMAEISAADWKKPGIGGTPAFAIDGNVLAGTHSWSALEPQLAARL